MVGGPGDVLTTKSLLYTSPSAVGRDMAISDSTNKNKDLSGDILSTSNARGEMVAGEVAKSNGHSEQASTVAKPAESVRDYSSCPELQGPPRVGDKLAFKV